MKKTFLPRLGFTLVELIVSTAIISLIMLVLVAMTNQTSQMWQSTTEKIEKFEEARDGYESMTRQISQATLNTYYDYVDKSGAVRDKNIGTATYNAFVPYSYARASELRFVSGPMSVFKAQNMDRQRSHGIFFAAPLGTTNTASYAPLENLLNIFGYYVETGQEDSRPSFITNSITPPRWRSRLKEFRQASEKMDLYDMGASGYDPNSASSYNWFNLSLVSSSRVLAENVIALIILPKLSQQDQAALAGGSKGLCPAYQYDSMLAVNYQGTANDANLDPHNQLPPVVQVTMIAIDERSARRYLDQNGGQATGAPKFFGVDPMGAFTDSTKLELPAGSGSTGELASYEQLLVKAGMTYRIFSSNVSIRGAKWTRTQTN